MHTLVHEFHFRCRFITVRSLNYGIQDGRHIEKHILHFLCYFPPPPPKKLFIRFTKIYVDAAISFMLIQPYQSCILIPNMPDNLLTLLSK